MFCIFQADELMEYYRDVKNEDAKHLREYTNIIYESPVYPVFYDNKRRLVLMSILNVIGLQNCASLLLISVVG
jgi:hypothetical protein